MKGLGVDFSRDHFIEAVSPENCFIKFPVIIDYFFIGLSQVHANEFDIIDIVFVHIIGNDISSRI